MHRFPCLSDRWLLLLFLAALAPGVSRAQDTQAKPKPQPDVLVFTNGDQLTGKFTRGEGDSVLFHSDMAGDLTIPLAKIKELRAGGSFAVLTKADLKKKGKPPQIGPIQVNQDALRVTPPAGVEETVPAAEVAFVIDRATYDKELESRPHFFSRWTGSITGGATLVRATDSGETFTTTAALVRAIPDVGYLPKRNRTIFDVAETFGKLSQPAIPQAGQSASLTKTNIFHTDAERDQYFSQRFYALADTSFDHNYSLGLNLQQVYGAGFGWTPIDSAIQNLDLRIDIHYEKQQFQVASNNTNLIGSKLSETYRRNLPGKIVFNQAVDFLPAFNNATDYSANATAGITLPVFHRLGVNFNTTDNFLNNPSPGFKKNSFQFVAGVSYSLQ